jgi:predicted phosphodiesterase
VRTTDVIPLAAFLLLSCQPFKYSPTILEAEKHEPELNLAALERIAGDSALADASQGKTIRIAVMADTHLWYDELRAAVVRINQDTALDFVVIAGDVTKFAYAEEYRIFANIIKDFKAPVLVGVGNHDVQADGKALFERLFGPTDFSFTFRGTKFVFFDDNARGIPEGIPDWDWVDSVLAGAGDSLKLVTVCHAPPYTDQLDGAQSARMVTMFAKHRVEIALGGHTHSWDYQQPYGDGIPYLVTDDIGDRNYAVVTLSPAGPTVERVYF